MYLTRGKPVDGYKQISRYIYILKILGSYCIKGFLIRCLIYFYNGSASFRSDCEMFIASFAEFIIDEINIPSDCF